MIRGAVLLIYFLATSICMGQEIGFGIVLGVESRSSALLETGDAGILARAEINTPVLSPEVEFGYQPNKLLNIAFGLSYRKQTLSISAWNPGADTCRFCPLVKGGGPSAHEIRLRPSAHIKLLQHGNTRVFLSMGIIWAIRFGQEANLSDMPVPYKPIFGELSGLLGSNPLYFSGGVGIKWKRFMGELRHERTSSYSEQAKLHGYVYPFQLNESRLLLYLSFRLNMLRG